MLRSMCSIAILALAGAMMGCAGRHSSSGFRLPPDGDAERGKAAFLAKGCHHCHDVSGTTLPEPVAPPVQRVALGGEITSAVTDGHLVTSIIHPTYRIARQAKTAAGPDGKTRMPAFCEDMTVRELTDIVAFLQSHYTEPRLPRTYATFH